MAAIPKPVRKEMKKQETFQRKRVSRLEKSDNPVETKAIRKVRKKLDQQVKGKDIHKDRLKKSSISMLKLKKERSSSKSDK